MPNLQGWNPTHFMICYNHARAETASTLHNTELGDPDVDKRTMGRAQLKTGNASVVPSPIACVVVFWATVWVAASSADLDSDLVETEAGWKFTDVDEVEPFGVGNTMALAPAAKPIKDRMVLADGDFELANVTGNASVLATDGTVLPNWLPGGAGVYVITSVSYQMSAFDKSSKFAVHLNNPGFTGNGTQGSLTTTLDTTPKGAFTVQYDCARMPDGPLNLLSALKVTTMVQHLDKNVETESDLDKVKYNATDTASQITWQRQSNVFFGEGGTTKITFESMSEKYGPIIDNVVLLKGIHFLNAAALESRVGVWQFMCPLFSHVVVVVVMAWFLKLPGTD